MADADPNASNESSSGFTLDLSTGKAPSRRSRKKKGPVAVVQKTINLSTPKSEKPAELANEPATRPSPKPNTSKGSGPRTKRSAAPRSGTSLADLLDPETLARLRGE